MLRPKRILRFRVFVPYCLCSGLPSSVYAASINESIGLANGRRTEMRRLELACGQSVFQGKETGSEGRGGKEGEKEVKDKKTHQLRKRGARARTEGR